MDLYGEKSASIPQKFTIITAELVLLLVSYRIVFTDTGATIYRWLSLAPPIGNATRNTVNFLFSCIVFLRMTFAMIFLVKRKLPVEETFSIPMAFALYYLGFALLTIDSNASFRITDYAAIAIFIFGSFINTTSELNRHVWKRDRKNQRRLYTSGLFSYAMHVNYFGDVLWVCGFAMLSRNPWAWLIPFFLLSFFIFYNIPKLDEHLRRRYDGEFDQYAARTRRLIPFIY